MIGSRIAEARKKRGMKNKWLEVVKRLVGRNVCIQSVSNQVFYDFLPAIPTTVLTKRRKGTLRRLNSPNVSASRSSFGSPRDHSALGYRNTTSTPSASSVRAASIAVAFATPNVSTPWSPWSALTASNSPCVLKDFRPKTKKEGRPEGRPQVSAPDAVATRRPSRRFARCASRSRRGARPRTRAGTASYARCPARSGRRCASARGCCA